MNGIWNSFKATSFTELATIVQLSHIVLWRIRVGIRARIGLRVRCRNIDTFLRDGRAGRIRFSVCLQVRRWTISATDSRHVSSRGISPSFGFPGRSPDIRGGIGGGRGPPNKSTRRSPEATGRTCPNSHLPQVLMGHKMAPKTTNKER